MRLNVLLVVLVGLLGVGAVCGFGGVVDWTAGAYDGGEPYVRWWWFAGVFEERDIRFQLDWMKEKGFGGVEVAFIYPVGRDPEAKRVEWLGDDWQKAVLFAKKYGDEIGLGVDFTFGTLWPFGGTFVADEDRTRVFGDDDFKQKLRLSWTHPKIGNVVNHMDGEAFRRYAGVMGEALAPALKGRRSGLFCDSWEVETRRIWTEGFGEAFLKRYGYDVRPVMKRIYEAGLEGERYDYMTLVSEYAIGEFYQEFTKEAHRLGAFSRAQCAGAPVDLLTAYGAVDVPETEAMLYEPGFSRIVASAATLAGRRVVSAETFTCIYGWPNPWHKREQTADLKLVADALFANGVNQIVWHGAPYQPKGHEDWDFYATVHVGRTGALEPELLEFNRYMTRVSRLMRKGKNYWRAAVWLPLEDAWSAGEYPEALRMKWSWGEYELRYVKMPPEIKGHAPLWVNHHYLKRAQVKRGKLHVGDAVVSVLAVDVKYLDSGALDTILDVARRGVPVWMKRAPLEPGKRKSGDYEKRLRALMKLENVSADWKAACAVPPVVEGDHLPDFWCRRDGGDFYIFFAHPRAQNLTLPLSYGQSFCSETIARAVKIHVNGRTVERELRFLPYRSILLYIDKNGESKELEISFSPQKPVVKSDPRERDRSRDK